VGGGKISERRQARILKKRKGEHVVGPLYRKDEKLGKLTGAFESSPGKKKKVGVSDDLL